MPAAGIAARNPLRQKSSVLVGGRTAGDDDDDADRDVIPSLPRVSYSEGGEALGYHLAACVLCFISCCASEVAVPSTDKTKAACTHWLCVHQIRSYCPLL